MKKIIAVILVLVLTAAVFAGCNGGGDTDKLVVGTSPDYAPYAFLDLTKDGQDQYVGAEADLAKHIADELGMEVEFEFMEFGTLVQAVVSGKIDIAISGFSYTAERAEQVTLIGPYGDDAEDQQSMMVPADMVGEYTSWEDFEGLTVAAQSGSLQQNIAENQLLDVTIEPVSTIQDGILMVQGGKVDGFVVASVTGEEYAKNNDAVAMLDIYFESDAGLYALVGIDNDELADKVAPIIEAVGDTYQEWLDAASELSDTLSE